MAVFSLYWPKLTAKHENMRNIKTYDIYTPNLFIMITEQALYITFLVIKQMCQHPLGQTSSVTLYSIYSITANLLFVQKQIV